MSRIALAGNNLAAVYTLDLLLDALDAADVLVIAPNPADVAPWQQSLAEHSSTRQVECLTPPNVNAPEIAERLAAHEPDLFLSVYYTQIFRDEVMDVIRGKAFNFHPSLLPRHRGNAPLIWAIVEGDRTTGLSVHHIDAGIDTGNVILQYALPIHERDTGYTLHRKMANLVRAAAGDLLREFLSGKPIAAGQPQTGGASYHSLRDPRVNHLVWSDSRERIYNIVRALAPPLPGAFALADATRFVISDIDFVEAPTGVEKTPGMVEVGRDGAPVVWAGDGALRITTAVLDNVATAGATLVERGVVGEGQVLD